MGESVNKSTHWSVQDDAELWQDDPCTTPIEAAAQFMENSDNDDDNWDAWNDMRKGFTTLTVHGWIITDKLLDPEVAFDGYEPGQTYYAPTGETCTVSVRTVYRVETP